MCFSLSDIDSRSIGGQTYEIFKKATADSVANSSYSSDVPSRASERPHIGDHNDKPKMWRKMLTRYEQILLRFLGFVAAGVICVPDAL